MTFPALWSTLAVSGGDVEPLLELLGSNQPGIADLVRNYLSASGAR